MMILLPLMNDRVMDLTAHWKATKPSTVTEVVLLPAACHAVASVRQAHARVLTSLALASSPPVPLTILLVVALLTAPVLPALAVPAPAMEAAVAEAPAMSVVLAVLAVAAYQSPPSVPEYTQTLHAPATSKHALIVIRVVTLPVAIPLHPVHHKFKLIPASLRTTKIL
jgi:hypothetical protein